MTKLSVNVNKIATLRNARGGNIPNVLKVTLDCESFGAEGITVHPRPDERHIRYADVYELRPAVSTRIQHRRLSLRKISRHGSQSETHASDRSFPMHTMSLHQMQVGTPKTTSIFFPKWSTFVNQRIYEPPFS